MKNLHYIRIAFLFVALLTVLGCSSKQDKSIESTVVTQDKADASKAAARVYSLMQSGEFSTIYKESAPGFKKTGSESQFVSFMQQFHQKTGSLKNAKEVDYKIGTDKELGTTHLVSFKLEYDKTKQKQILTLVRSKSGKMELVAIEQDLSKN